MKNLDLQRGKIPNFVRLKSREAISQQVADMHRLFAIPQYLLEVLSETTRSWEAVSKEKKITPTAYDLVPDLKKRLKQKRGHGINGLNVDERSVQTWLNLIGLSHTPALSFEENPEIEDLVPDQAINQSPEISFFAKEREEKLKEFVKFLNNGSGLTKKEKSALMGVWKIDGRGISRRKKEPIKNFKRRYLRVWDYVRRARRKLQKNPKVKTFYKELVTE